MTHRLLRPKQEYFAKLADACGLDLQLAKQSVRVGGHASRYTRAAGQRDYQP